MGVGKVARELISAELNSRGVKEWSPFASREAPPALATAPESSSLSPSSQSTEVVPDSDEDVAPTETTEPNGVPPTSPFLGAGVDTMARAFRAAIGSAPSVTPPPRSPEVQSAVEEEKTLEAEVADRTPSPEPAAAPLPPALPTAPVPLPAPDEGRRTPRRVVGSRVRKLFVDDFFEGKVTASRDDEHWGEIFSIAYDDGDEEELTRDELALVLLPDERESPTAALARRREAELWTAAASELSGPATIAAAAGVLTCPRTRLYSAYVDVFDASEPTRTRRHTFDHRFGTVAAAAAARDLLVRQMRVKGSDVTLNYPRETAMEVLFARAELEAVPRSATFMSDTETTTAKPAVKPAAAKPQAEAKRTLGKQKEPPSTALRELEAGEVKRKRVRRPRGTSSSREPVVATAGKKWTDDESATVMRLVRDMGTNDWRAIAEAGKATFGHRTPKAICRKWNYLQQAEREKKRAPSEAGRMELMPADVAAELSAVLDEDETREGFPLRLISRRVLHALNGAFRESRGARKRYPVNWAWMNPQDMADLGIDEEALVEVASPHGRLLTRAKAEERLRRGVVSMTHMFGQLVGGDDPDAEGGGNVGQLCSLSEGLEAINFMPRFSGVAVRVSAKQ